ncbi:MAG: UDP-N-acetylmuramoyl-L-alanyl-D-glutamate--2,6-diaminopimelate ligase [Alphaproteobacteria bacterium]|nr:UDP-N-acetylmuramoyl-L-alanyl-D-glutamate--2,6-diaminopimelate ligase [Alphaproteobacteria bacterium]MCB9984309.1 UDP-N-acetylmuramoyl-L-alanyl-D-glutamate--2,6-diaminopimelate ligase [Micavibrio sp.]HPQ50759.1 UDP-N-acetylmuramoyl-L-alanyl-D-glutamate--2,6-diaminopimelate ligase [Alphaproteobacteria bacterium]HRK97153.1 UDP-N-acetylmuramoyl-L-alanyl-D-glutamate--2,6-diaminopimelate ligase [Alphaproteobacteria bacterium]
MNGLLEKITSITADSRQVTEGGMFVAIAGVKQDGRQFIQSAIEKGASVIVVPKGTHITQSGIEIIEVENPRAYLAQAAAIFYGVQPETIVTVTGTNGKTSTVNFVREIWKNLGLKSASLGTLGLIGDGLDDYSGMTTPDPVALHQSLKLLADKGFSYLAMEASSIGIEQNRLDGVRISAAGFTNLTRDHLDYHGSMEDYLQSKLHLFSHLLDSDGIAIVNADTNEYARIKEACNTRGIACWGYGQNGSEINLISREVLPHGQVLNLEVLGQKYSVMLPLVGEFQAMNALCALGLVLANTAFQTSQIVDMLGRLSGVPGRLQQVPGNNEDYAVYVDYAHTPDALDNILKALRPHTTGRLICLFGCGGDRDTGKRPVMGEISTRLADVSIVTDDNPRSEDPQKIRKQILEGAQNDAIEIDGRRNAIRQAVQMLCSGDVLVLAGKGHEQGQTFATHTEPFDDVLEAQQALKIKLSSQENSSSF